MDGYELTERGKILSTVLIVFLIFILPATILVVNAFASASPYSSDDPDMRSPEPAPIISDGTQPDGSDIEPIESDDAHPATSGGDSDPDEYYPQNGNGPPTTALFGPTGGNPSGGTLSFLFSPDLQNELDAETWSLLDVFLGSTRNTSDSIIAVETPELPEEYSDILESAVYSALNARGIPAQRIEYFTDHDVPMSETFEVNLSYIATSTQGK